MAKNRVASDRNPKPKDNFFKKAQSKFNNTQLHPKNKKEGSQSAPSAQSDNFFIESPGARTLKEPGPSEVRNLRGNREPKTDKKPFDKKKYRLQKYSKKYKLQQWEDKRKKAVLRSYYKNVKEGELNPTGRVYEDHENETNQDSVISEVNKNQDKKIEDEDGPRNSKEKRNKSFRKAQQEFQRIKEEKEKKKDLSLKKKAEKDEALQAYKKKKIEKFRKLNKKNKKGQPIMKGRIELLLEKIQNSIN